MARDWTTPEAWTDTKAISTARLNALSTQLTWLYEMMFAKEGSALTIASGVLTVTGNEAYFKVSGQGAAADDLVTINGGTDGDIIILAYDGEAITLKDTVNIDTGDYGDLVMDAAGNLVIVRYDGSNWVLLATNVKPTYTFNVTKTVVMGGLAGIAVGDKVMIPRIGQACTLTEWYIESKGFLAGSVETDLNHYTSWTDEALDKLADINLSSADRNSATGLTHSIGADDKLEMECKVAGSTLTQVSVTLVFEVEIS